MTHTQKYTFAATIVSNDHQLGAEVAGRQSFAANDPVARFGLVGQGDYLSLSSKPLYIW